MVEQKWRFKLASQERCERLKRSFGGWRTMILYLEPAEQSSLQGLDQWNYETGVPRAQTNFTLSKVYYFLGDRKSGRVDYLDVPSNRVRNYTVKGMGRMENAVQTRIGLILVGRHATRLVTKSKDSDELLKAPRKAPPVQHVRFALTALGDSHLVYTGGRDTTRDCTLKKTTLFYNFEADEWKEGPDLNEARYHHSSCSLGDFTYVIAGYTGNTTNSIERLNAKESILKTARSSLTHQWERVQVLGATLEPCHQPLVCQLNDKELLILGGWGNDRRALALHHESLELRLLSDNLSVGVDAFANQSVKLCNNKVAARVRNMDKRDERDYLITYTPEEPDTIQIVKDLGEDNY